MDMEIKGNLPPIHPTPELPPLPSIPGFEELKRGELKYILNSLKVNNVENIDFTDLNSLQTIPIDLLMKIRDNNDFLGRGGDLAACNPIDHCDAIRKAITERIHLLQEAARHAGSNITDKDDVENELNAIAESQHGKPPPQEDDFPF